MQNAAKLHAHLKALVLPVFQALSEPVARARLFANGEEFERLDHDMRLVWLGKDEAFLTDGPLADLYMSASGLLYRNTVSHDEDATCGMSAELGHLSMVSSDTLAHVDLLPFYVRLVPTGALSLAPGFRERPATARA